MATNLGAQEIKAVYPTTAVALQETRFTAEGLRLPTENTARSGLKLSTLPAGACLNARRYQEATSRKYYFSCEFKPSSGPVALFIHHKHKGKSEQLWRGTIEVLPGPTEITGVTISGNQPSSEARVRCDGISPCFTVAGNLAQSEQLSFLVLGKNLPRELQLDAEGCVLQALASAAKSSEVREFTCRPAASTPGRKVRLLSGPATQNGLVLWSAELGAATAPN